MPENFVLFEDAIQEIKEYADLNHDDFNIICNEVREVLSKFGNQLSPSVVVDLIESAVSIYTMAEVRKEIDGLTQLTPELAVSLAAKDLGLEMDYKTLEDNLYFSSSNSSR